MNILESELNAEDHTGILTCLTCVSSLCVYSIILFILFLISKNPPCQDLKFCIKKHARIGGARDFGLYVILITSVHIVIYFQGVIAVNSGGGIE